MRTLAVGDYGSLGDVLYAVETAQGTTPGSVGRVDNAFDALELLDAAEPTILFLYVSGAEDPGLGQIRTLVSRGARVIVLAKEVSAEVRVEAIRAGAREVLFAPWTLPRVQARISGALEGSTFIAAGAPTDFRALLLPEGTHFQLSARVTNLSTAGFVAEGLTGTARPDEIVRAAIQVPPPEGLPVLFARLVGQPHGGSASFRFLGLTADEEDMVDAVTARAIGLPLAPRAKRPAPAAPVSAPVEATDDPDDIQVFEEGPAEPDREPPPDPEDRTIKVARRNAAGGPEASHPATPPAASPQPTVDPDAEKRKKGREALDRVSAAIDADFLRDGPPRWMGNTLPALTDAERAGLVRGSPLGEVALWRTRAHVIASILEATPSLTTKDLPWKRWRAYLADARDTMKTEVSARLAEGDAAAVRDLREVQARVNAISDRIDRLARGIGIEVARQAEPAAPDAPDVSADLPLPSTQEALDKAVAEIAAEDVEVTRKKTRRSWLSLAGRGRAIGLLSVALALLGVLVAVRHARQDHGPRPERRLAAKNPIAEVNGVRIRSTFKSKNKVVVVVDRSWYDLGLQKDPGGSAATAKAIATRLGAKGPLEVRDIAGWRVAYLDGLSGPPGGTATPRPPEPRSPGSGPEPGPPSPSR